MVRHRTFLPCRRAVRAIAWASVWVLLLSGCAYVAERNRDYRRQHHLPPGSGLIVEQALPVAAGRRDVFIQRGRVRPSGAVDRYQLYCELVLRHLSDQRRSVAPGRYEIIAANPFIDRHGVSRATVRYAAFGIGGDPAPSPQRYGIRLQLQGAPGCDVEQMLCGSLYDPYEARYPTVAELQSALGTLARIETVPGH